MGNRYLVIGMHCARNNHWSALMDEYTDKDQHKVKISEGDWAFCSERSTFPKNHPKTNLSGQ